MEKKRRKRRAFTPEFKAETAKLVLAGERAIPRLARDVDLTGSALRNRVEQTRADAGRGPPGVPTSAERQELASLRHEVKVLRMERELLRTAAAFFAKESA